MCGIETRLLAAGVAALLAAPTLAQTGRPQPGDRGDAVGRTVAEKDLERAQGPFASVYQVPLFANPDVQRELKITPEQADRLTAARNKLRSRFEDQVGQLARLPARDRQAREADLVQAYQKGLAQATADVLSEKQLKRYRQIELQARGPAAFNDPAIQKQLNLTDEQRQRLRALNDANDREVQAIRQAAATDPALARRRSATLQQNTVRSVGDILNTEQRRIWERMVGETFHFRPVPVIEGTGTPSGR
jgi:hypothetical protein